MVLHSEDLGSVSFLRSLQEVRQVDHGEGGGQDEAGEDDGVLASDEVEEDRGHDGAEDSEEGWQGHDPGHRLLVQGGAGQGVADTRAIDFTIQTGTKNIYAFRPL